MERNPEIERLAKSFYDFLRDSTTFGGSYKSNIPLHEPNTVLYDIADYHFEARFTDEYQCELTITNGSRIEEMVSVPYHKESNKPDWTNFLEGIFILARNLT